jgi:hypothetical protein
MLRASGDGLIAAEITSRLDLPDTAPYAVQWSPFLTGFPYGKHYVLGRTMLDEHAPRTGMVFTHALISSLDEMADFNDLQTLIALLCEQPCPDKTVSTIEVQPHPLPYVQATPEQIAIAMLLASYGKVPVIRLGCQGFDKVVAELWAKLWPSIRRGFAFRLSFGPSDLVESPLPSLVCTPQNLASRWIGYRTATVDVTPKSLSPAAAVLTGAQKGGNLLDCASRFGIEIATFRNLNLLERAYSLQELPASLDNTIALLRIVEALSSGQPTASAGREEVVAGLLQFLPDATAKQALSLRNVTLASFEKPDRIWNALKQWMADYKFPPNEDAEIMQFLGGLDDAAFAVPEWQHAIVTGLNTAGSEPNPHFSEAFWRWGRSSSDVYEHVFRYIQFSAADDVLLVEVAPDEFPSKSAKELLKLSISQHLYRLHGVAASMAFPPMEAVSIQLDADKEGVSSPGIQMALRKAQPIQLIECALAFHNSQLTELAATAASLQPDLLADVDMNSETAQAIWTASLSKNQACWAGPKHPEQTFHMILNKLLDGKTAETPLVMALTNTPLANLNNYTRREEVWKSFGGDTKERLMIATAAGWLSKVEKGMTSPMEDEVQSHIVNSPSFPSTVGRFFSMSLGSALRLISLLSSLTEQSFLGLLPLLTSRALTPLDSETLGRLLLARDWSDAAEHAASLLRQGREDVRPALRACYSLLGLRTRFRLRLAPLSANEKWQALEQVAADLYPSGPDHSELWRKAGGSNADLQHNGDGRARWADALFKIRHGYNLRISSLLARMSEDYPGNDDLRYISNDPEFRKRA